MRATSRMLLWLADRRKAQRFISRAPLARQVARRFVAGEHPDEAVSALRQLQARGLGGILNLLGEGVTDAAEADAATGTYVEAIAAAAAAGLPATVTIKLTQLGLAFDRAGCEARLRRIGGSAARLGLGLEVDMEHSEYVAFTIDAYLAAGLQPPPRLAVQAYLHRTPDDLRALVDRHVPIRLVKGAYLEPPATAIQDDRAVSERYRELATLLLERGVAPAFGTHDSSLIDHVVREAQRLRLEQASFEFQLLYGVRVELQQRLARQGFRVRVYVPFGAAWYPYLVRRLAERPANLRLFVRSLVSR